MIQKRIDGTIDFQRPWCDYLDGFGDLLGQILYTYALTFLFLFKKVVFCKYLEIWAGDLC